MCACAGVFARVRAHACAFMRGCVWACVVGPTCARVRACLRARARMRRVHVHARSRAGARARKCKCPHEGMRLYMYVGVRACNKLDKYVFCPVALCCTCHLLFSHVLPPLFKKAYEFGFSHLLHAVCPNSSEYSSMGQLMHFLSTSTVPGSHWAHELTDFIAMSLT